ncbi:MAG: pre-peptidase C-terminal domain-containing protein, partial [Bacteroidales bacterium]|nr:pre-peptidase C-terminal domain-containing protein [Bacteroidales bacterium]
MKTTCELLKKMPHPLRWILCTVLISCCLGYSYGQTGNTLANPVVAGSFGSAFQYSNSQNTDDFTNDYVGRPNNDVFYKFTLTVPMTVTISHCGSTLGDTYLHLLDASGNRIAYNDDYSGQCSSHYHSYLKKVLYAGTYYVVSEG